MRMGRIPEAKSLIDAVRDSSAEIEFGDEPFTKSYDRAVEMLAEVESKDPEDGLSDKFYAGCSFANRTMKENKAPRNANRNHSHHLLDKRERGSVGPRMDETGPYLPTEKVDQLQSSDTRERKNKRECLQEEWGVLEKSPEAALDVDQTIFVAVL
ncbi:hypothetical protein HID58_022929, partial [Brassica napus]